MPTVTVPACGAPARPSGAATLLRQPPRWMRHRGCRRRHPQFGQRAPSRASRGPSGSSIRRARAVPRDRLPICPPVHGRMDRLAATKGQCISGRWGCQRTAVECKRPAISSFHERPAICHPPPARRGADLAKCLVTAPRVRDQPRPDPRAHGATAAAHLEPWVRPVRRLLAACRSESGAVALRTATAAVGRRTTSTTQSAPDWSSPPPPTTGTPIAPI